jgi:hypothetical protein
MLSEPESTGNHVLVTKVLVVWANLLTETTTPARLDSSDTESSRTETGGWERLVQRLERDHAEMMRDFFNGTQPLVDTQETAEATAAK